MWTYVATLKIQFSFYIFSRWSLNDARPSRRPWLPKLINYSWDNITALNIRSPTSKAGLALSTYIQHSIFGLCFYAIFFSISIILPKSCPPDPSIHPLGTKIVATLCCSTLRIGFLKRSNIRVEWLSRQQTRKWRFPRCPILKFSPLDPNGMNGMVRCFAGLLAELNVLQFCSTPIV